MPIELHCPKCAKLIRAPENAGGQHGKCPYCMASVYVPMPADDTDIIPLAPVDEEEERRAEEERRKSLEFAAAVDKATEGAGGADPGARGRAAAASAAPRRAPQEVPGQVVDIGEEVKLFIYAMRDSKLDQAESATARLRKAGPRARDYVEGLLLDEMPPQVENVPPPLVQGFLKNLLARLA